MVETKTSEIGGNLNQPLILLFCTLQDGKYRTDFTSIEEDAKQTFFLAYLEWLPSLEHTEKQLQLENINKNKNKTKKKRKKSQID